MIAIVEGSASDIASIMPVMHDAFDPRFGEAWTAAQCLAALSIPGSGLMIAKAANTVCGFALSRWVLDSEELLMIGVSKDMQRQSVGKKLIQEVVQLAKAGNRTQLFLEVRDGNVAQSFYSQVGFKQIGRRKHYYTGIDGEKPDAITMSLLIA